MNGEATFTDRERDASHLRALVQDLLRLSTLPSLQDNFFRLGGDSLDAMVLAEELGSHLKREISPDMVFGAPTLGDMLEQTVRANEDRR